MRGVTPSSDAQRVDQPLRQQVALGRSAATWATSVSEGLVRDRDTGNRSCVDCIGREPSVVAGTRHRRPRLVGGVVVVARWGRRDIGAPRRGGCPHHGTRGCRRGLENSATVSWVLARNRRARARRRLEPARPIPSLTALCHERRWHRAKTTDTKPSRCPQRLAGLVTAPVGALPRRPTDTARRGWPGSRPRRSSSTEARGRPAEPARSFVRRHLSPQGIRAPSRSGARHAL
jgi:hypothetical protein